MPKAWPAGSMEYHSKKGWSQSIPTLACWLNQRPKRGKRQALRGERSLHNRSSHSVFVGNSVPGRARYITIPTSYIIKTPVEKEWKPPYFEHLHHIFRSMLETAQSEDGCVKQKP